MTALHRHPHSFTILQKRQDGPAAPAGGACALAVQVLGLDRLFLGLRDGRLRLRGADLVGGARAQEAAGVHLPKLPEEHGGLKVCKGMDFL